MTNKGGRPPLYKTPEDLERAVDEYLELCERENYPVTLSGLCLALGFHSKDTFYEYGKKEGFSDPIKRARLHVEAAYEKRLYGPNPGGAIFALKNMGWSDKMVLSGDPDNLAVPVLNVFRRDASPTDKELERIIAEGSD